MNRESFAQYLAFLDDLGAALEELTGIEQEKTRFVREDDLDGLNECIKKEQALSMTLRSYDQKRTAMLAALGLEGVPLRKLAAHAPDEQSREQAVKTVERLIRRYELFRGAMEVARDTLECNLHQIEKAIRAEDPERAAQTGYPGAPVDLPPQMKTDFRA